MHSPLPLRNASMALLLLGTALMTGCQTGSIGTKLEQSGAVGACSVWPGVSYSTKLDTPKTVASARSNNRARKAFCSGLEQEKK